MKVVVTGGAGFLGQRLARELLRRGSLRRADGEAEAIDRVVLVDLIPPPSPADPRVEAISGDVADSQFVAGVLTPDTASVFHLAAIVSGMAEADFDLGMRINVDATRRLLDRCRDNARTGLRPRVVFASSVAVYGGGSLPDTVPETASVTPQSSYGTEKAIGELLINEYTRRGFIDGRALRLPTVSVRPGRPNAAASSFASGIIREPLNGQDAVCPVESATRLWLSSPRSAIDGLIVGHDAPPDALGLNRILNIPGLSVTAGEMAAALGRVAGPGVAGLIRWERDPRVSSIVASWPGELDTTRARSLGFRGDESFDAIIRQYMIDDLRRS